MMDSGIKDMWVDALRSKNYKQGTGALHYGNMFCCLGVLCDIYLKEKGESWAEPDEGMTMPRNYKLIGDNSETLPYCVMTWAGLRSEDPAVLTDAYLDEGVQVDDFVPLSQLNDNGMSFDDIADRIENTDL